MGATAEAATYTVTNPAGNDDAGTLKDMVGLANATLTEDDTIVFASNLSGTITLTGGVAVGITDAVQINGGGRITVSGAGASRVVTTTMAVGNEGEAVGLNGLTMIAGAGTDGGGIFNPNAVLTVNGSVVSGSTATGDGGGIFNGDAASTAIINSTISGNTAADDGGGVFSFAGALDIANSTISGNTATPVPAEAHYGGGVHAYSGPLTITSSTIASNTAGDGGGIYRDSGPAVLLRSTIVADNTATIAGPDLGIDGTFAGDFAFVENPGAALTAVTPGSNVVGQDPQLAGLAGNGGSTLTRLPSAASPVLDKGRAFGFATDQRGQARPFDLPSIPNGSSSDGTDIGAVELGAPPGGDKPAVKKCKKKKKKAKKGASAAAKPKKKKSCKKKKKKKK